MAIRLAHASDYHFMYGTVDYHFLRTFGPESEYSDKFQMVKWRKDPALNFES